MGDEGAQVEQAEDEDLNEGNGDVAAVSARKALGPEHDGGGHMDEQGEGEGSQGEVGLVEFDSDVGVFVAQQLHVLRLLLGTLHFPDLGFGLHDVDEGDRVEGHLADRQNHVPHSQLVIALDFAQDFQDDKADYSECHHEGEEDEGGAKSAIGRGGIGDALEEEADIGVGEEGVGVDLDEEHDEVGAFLLLLQGGGKDIETGERVDGEGEELELEVVELAVGHEDGVEGEEEGAGGQEQEDVLPS